MYGASPLRRTPRGSIAATPRTAIAIQLVALALTVGTVARVVVGRSGALVVAICVFGVALIMWATLALLDGRRRGRRRLGRAGS